MSFEGRDEDWKNELLLFYKKIGKMDEGDKEEIEGRWWKKWKKKC